MPTNVNNNYDFPKLSFHSIQETVSEQFAYRMKQSHLASTNCVFTRIVEKIN